ncbi:hypothetical protein BDD12DRAFT_166826 [Trichophaea hybrida]|nr:hypothetical protein BDD12DRAFT_166826 [Trichophaea hybrida]
MSWTGVEAESKQGRAMRSNSTAYECVCCVQKPPPTRHRQLLSLNKRFFLAFCTIISTSYNHRAPAHKPNMFKNFSFPSSPSSTQSSVDSQLQTPTSSRPRKTASSSSSSFLHPSSAATASASLSKDPLTPPLSPMHSPAPSPADASSCYTYFNASHHDALTSTLFSLALSQQPSPDVSDNESEPEQLVFEDVRRKRQSMARMQTNEDLLRQLGELVKRVSAGRKGSACSLSESSGVQKSRSRSRGGKRAKSRETGKRRIAAA